MNVDGIIENMLKDVPADNGGADSDTITRDEFENALNVNLQKAQKEIQEGLKANLDALMAKIDERQSAGKVDDTPANESPDNSAKENIE